MSSDDASVRVGLDAVGEGAGVGAGVRDDQVVAGDRQALG
jgi:hypothetical protein